MIFEKSEKNDQGQDTNYISITDLAELFGKNAILYGDMVVISDAKELINENEETNLLRYLQAQISIY